MYNPIGSIWNKWDLHIHTNASDGKGSCQEILDEAVAKGIKCIAVTDHHTVENVDLMKHLAESMDITVISGVEFRTEYGNSSVHIIGLFPDEYDNTRLDSEFLKENVLNVLGISRSSIIKKGKSVSAKDGMSDDAYFKEGMFYVQVDFRKAAEIIHKYGGLVSVHAGSKSNSIDEEMKHEGKSPKNVPLQDSLGPVKEELFKNGYIDFCDLTKPKEGAFYLNKFGIPSITTSDAHEVNKVGTNACWIKADLTFDGLRQALVEHERISSKEPNILKRVKKSPDKFLKQLEVRRTADATMSEIWFDKIRIPLNPGLIAVIGNKGSGKSALTDIIALSADSSNQNWAFLTLNKFRMTKPFNRSRQTEAFIQWQDNSISNTKTLDMSSDTTKPERVKYIPQNFLESLCTSAEENDFEKELKKIIFQYLDPAQKFGLNDLDSVIQYLSKEINSSCEELQSRIKSINTEIIEKEQMLDPEYRLKLVNQLAYKQEQLKNIESAKPKEVAKPSIEDNSETSTIKEEIENIQKNCNKLSLTIQNEVSERQILIKNIQDLRTSKERLDRLKAQIDSVKSELRPLYDNLSIDLDSILVIAYHPELIDSKVQILSDRLDQIEKDLDADKSDSLQKQHNEVLQSLQKAQQKLSAPELEYQQYLKDKDLWEKDIADIIGSKTKDNTIEYIKGRIEYIDTQLKDDLSAQQMVRRNLVNELMERKKRILDTYRCLFAPIVKFIDDFRDDLKDYPIEFDSSFRIKDFGDNFFNYISQQAAGSYYGKEQGALRVKEDLDNIDESDILAITEFAHLVNENLHTDKRDNQNIPRSIEAQLKKGHTKQDLYDFIYGMEYVKPYFQIKMNGKPLSSLSPGERGALLLLLYLFIDMDDKPLIIDQPEENLDNESVFKYLVHFIKVAKKKRQIIMVTHNPNLAVVCDADQVIQMKIDKLNGNKVNFVSGAIENPVINKIIVDILEGTYPAFHNRDCKYFDKTI